jgi:hypothetical protein
MKRSAEHAHATEVGNPAKKCFAHLLSSLETEFNRYGNGRLFMAFGSFGVGDSPPIKAAKGLATEAQRTQRTAKTGADGRRNCHEGETRSLQTGLDRVGGARREVGKNKSGAESGGRGE